MSIPVGYVRNVCCIGQGVACCRFLILYGSHWDCAKVDAAFKTWVNDRARSGQMVAQGDNCPGWTGDQPDI